MSRLQAGEALGSAADLGRVEQLGHALAAAADVHANPFSAQRHRDLLSPILAQVSLDDLAGATTVDLGCGTSNPFTFSFLLLLMGAERAYAIDAEPVHDLAAATRALATAAGWLLVEPQRVLDRPGLGLEDVVRHLHGFDLSLLAAGDPAGLAPGRLMHRRESVFDCRCGRRRPTSSSRCRCSSICTR